MGEILHQKAKCDGLNAAREAILLNYQAVKTALTIRINHEQEGILGNVLRRAGLTKMVPEIESLTGYSSSTSKWIRT